MDKHQPPYRALLVEDHEPLAEATAELMQREGLEVRIALTGEDALKLAAAFLPEIVLCDVRLPDMSGFEVAQVLRGIVGAKTLIAIHTAFSQTDVHMFESKATVPVNMFLPKPLTTPKITALISELELLRRPLAPPSHRQKNSVLLKSRNSRLPNESSAKPRKQE